MQQFVYNFPSVLAVLVSCMFKCRLGFTMGVRDKFSPTSETILCIGCTHGHGSEGFQPKMPVEGMSLVPRPEQQLLVVHRTSSASWRRIVQDSAMITKKREALHFSTFRQKMTSSKEMVFTFLSTQLTSVRDSDSTLQ